MATFTPEIPIKRADITPRSGESAWWCLGCGDFGVNSAVQNVIMALVNEQGIPLENIFALSGIGCSSKEPEMLRLNAYQGQHGRSLPVAIGVAIANPGLKVIDFGGDGDSYAIGMEHFMHAIIRNVNITLIVMNNQVYGLTKGQASPTAHTGLRTPSTPDGKAGRPVNPLRLIQEASKIGREVTGLLLMDDTQPTMAENAGISAERAPATLDIALEPNIDHYRQLLAEMR